MYCELSICNIPKCQHGSWRVSPLALIRMRTDKVGEGVTALRMKLSQAWFSSLGHTNAAEGQETGVYPARLFDVQPIGTSGL